MAGVCITTLASFVNFGNNNWVQLQSISLLGYNASVIIGFVYAVGMALFAGKFMRWIDQG